MHHTCSMKWRVEGQRTCWREVQKERWYAARSYAGEPGLMSGKQFRFGCGAGFIAGTLSAKCGFCSMSALRTSRRELQLVSAILLAAHQEIGNHLDVYLICAVGYSSRPLGSEVHGCR